MNLRVWTVALALVASAVVCSATARADTFAVFPGLLPSAETQNAPNLSVPSALETAPVAPEQLSVEQLRPIWEAAGAAYGIAWPVLAAINKIESDFGRNMGPSSAGAVGWMQFMPETWLAWGMDASGDGVADPWNARDAVFSAARYLAASGGDTDIEQALFAYNHADWYVREVVDLAELYARTAGSDLAATPDGLAEERALAEQAVEGAQADLDRAVERVERLNEQHERALAEPTDETSISDQLENERRAAAIAVAANEQERVVEELRAVLATAEARLRLAEDHERAVAAAAASSGLQPLLAAPTSGEWVFPVGGGAALVSVGHTHHDYPAADIAAPAGTPVFALGAATVLRAWHLPEGRCGVGVTMQTADAQVWTYCHLSYLDPNVDAGAQLAVGTPLGLVGQTGRATGPHLHLQLQPTSSYPQEQAWFQSFAGSAFRWSDYDTPAPTPPADTAPAFSVIPS
jgi:murein DD-endopeptidase MepM/ murein hydrolase activator NlpD